MLLPRCVRLAPVVSLLHECDTLDAQCLDRLLERLPAVQRLTLERPAPQPSASGRHSWQWTSLRERLPRLTALTLRCVDVRWSSFLHPLLSAPELGELRELTIDCGSGCLPNSTRGPPHPPLMFRFPPPAAGDAAVEYATPVRMCRAQPARSAASG